MKSRGLLAGRLAVKIEICTDSSMRGGVGVSDSIEHFKALEDWSENQICHALSSTSFIFIFLSYTFAVTYLGWSGMKWDIVTRSIYHPIPCIYIHVYT